MSTEDIPPVDEESRGPASKSVEALEYDLLRLGEVVQTYENRERSQRLWLRWIAMVIGVGTILGFGALLVFILSKLFLGPFVLVSSSVAIALVTAPIVAISSITLALFAAAFRKQEENEPDIDGYSVGAALKRVLGASQQ